MVAEVLLSSTLVHVYYTREKKLVKVFLAIFTFQVWLSDRCWIHNCWRLCFCKQYPPGIKRARGAGSSFEPLTSFCKFSCDENITKWWEQIVFIHQPGWVVLLQMTIESFVYWNIKELPLFCHTIRNDNPVGIGTAITPRIAKLELIEYRFFFSWHSPYSHE